MNKNLKIRQLVIIAMLITIEMILTRFFAINAYNMRISLGFVPIAICAILYGPLWAGFAYGAADFIGVSLLSPYPPFPGMTLSAVLTGICFGIFLYKHNTPLNQRIIKLKEVIIPAVIIGLVINLFMDTYWLALISNIDFPAISLKETSNEMRLTLIMKNGFLTFLAMRLIRIIITIPLQIIMIPLIWNKFAKRAENLLQ